PRTSSTYVRTVWHAKSLRPTMPLSQTCTIEEICRRDVEIQMRVWGGPVENRGDLRTREVAVITEVYIERCRVTRSSTRSTRGLRTLTKPTMRRPHREITVHGNGDHRTLRENFRLTCRHAAMMVAMGAILDPVLIQR
ncbi:unnamed protein product, partial [Sphacelaria rigidula]